MTRNQHLGWAKERALALIDAGENGQAFASFTSDLSKHPELSGALEIQRTLGMMQLMAGHLRTEHDMRKWIEGFA